MGEEGDPESVGGQIRRGRGYTLCSTVHSPSPPHIILLWTGQHAMVVVVEILVVAGGIGTGQILLVLFFFFFFFQSEALLQSRFSPQILLGFF